MCVRLNALLKFPSLFYGVYVYFENGPHIEVDPSVILSEIAETYWVMFVL
jgi:hypothetical protein